jgi:hypothetical protein
VVVASQRYGHSSEDRGSRCNNENDVISCHADPRDDPVPLLARVPEFLDQPTFDGGMIRWILSWLDSVHLGFGTAFADFFPRHHGVRIILYIVACTREELCGGKVKKV